MLRCGRISGTRWGGKSHTPKATCRPVRLRDASRAGKSWTGTTSVVTKGNVCEFHTKRRKELKMGSIQTCFILHEISLKKKIKLFENTF